MTGTIPSYPSARNSTWIAQIAESPGRKSCAEQDCLEGRSECPATGTGSPEPRERVKLASVRPVSVLGAGAGQQGGDGVFGRWLGGPVRCERVHLDRGPTAFHQIGDQDGRAR